MPLRREPMTDISFDPVTHPDALATRWRRLEAAASGGFFRSWTYLGTLLPHFTAPYLLAVTRRGQDVALGLFNRIGSRLCLHETGLEPWDQLHVEHNGLLLHPSAPDVLPAALAVVASHGTVILSGIDDAHHAAAGAAGDAHLRKCHFAPAVAFTTLADPRQPYITNLSANARSQLRRAMRLFGDTLRLEPATTLPQAEHYFDRLVQLHQTSWLARGQRGAFADEPIRSFHRSLIRAGFPSGEVRLLRVATASRELGYLYEFRHSRRALSYQTGLASEPDPRLKPGLVCHVLAIEQARADGEEVYDFLAGAQRYKLTLAPHGGETMHWVTLYRRASLAAYTARLRRLVTRAAAVEPDSE
jgi:CelD/BcsL family acetyltransferase involved in cellulose biosynthesis